METTDPRHGTTRGYHAGCRDLCCRRAIARYEKEGRLARLRGGRSVRAIGTQRRIQALMRLGWTSHDIATAAGYAHRNAVFRVLRGQKGRPCVWLERATADRFHKVFERLSMDVPEMTAPRIRLTKKAEREGWPPPLAWEDIDDPDEQPRDWQYRPSSRLDTFAELVERQVSVSEACRILHVSPAGLEKWAYRTGNGPQWLAMAARETTGRWSA